MRETKRFIIDTLSHFPNLNIEWLAIDEDDHVERITRRKAPLNNDKKNEVSRGKGKGKAEDHWTTWLNGEQVPLLFPNTAPKNASALSDSDEDNDGDSEEVTRIETHNMPFHMAEGVEIFTSEIAHGWL